MVTTHESEPAAGRGAPRRSVEPWIRAGLGLALVFGVVCVGSACLLWQPAGAAPLARDLAMLRLDPNAASRTELMLLPDIGPSVSRRIIEYRERCPEQPAFRAADDLHAVRGVGPVTIARLRDYLRFEAPAELVERPL